MASKALVDEGKSDWALRNKDRLSGDYKETLCVGQGRAPPSGSSDSKIAEFCRKERCDLLTGDKKAYDSMLDIKGVKGVQISLYACEKPTDPRIYLVRMY